MNVIERYASAVRSTNLEINERTTRSDSDVLGAMGLASRQFPLAVALQRLFPADSNAARELVEIPADDAWRQARAMKVKLNRVRAYDLAQGCVAWHRNPTCDNCGGHGATVIPGSTTLGVKCKPCKGTGRTSLSTVFKGHAEVADWLVAHMEKHQAMAGPEAMKQIAWYLDLKIAVAEAVK
ncbi:hypothetical protein [Variovorax sp. GB1P17]|uniref:hypothetical protein n=1 Tax=Variovorax sp. GB1P17 TaxID=3443740 RepID=UPI003F4656F4